MITNVKPMSVEHARCLAMAYELHRLLGELNERPENGEGSCVDDAWDRMDGVVGMLEPDEPDEEAPRRNLRLVGGWMVRP
jgi:hypothetical protein